MSDRRVPARGLHQVRRWSDSKVLLYSKSVAGVLTPSVWFFMDSRSKVSLSAAYYTLTIFSI